MTRTSFRVEILSFDNTPATMFQLHSYASSVRLLLCWRKLGDDCSQDVVFIRYLGNRFESIGNRDSVSVRIDFFPAGNNLQESASSLDREIAAIFYRTSAVETLLSHKVSVMVAEQLSIETEDGATRLEGEFAIAGDSTHSTGALVIVPGGWFMERDGFMGNSYTGADLMYLRIARRVLTEGFAVARYDNRGVSGNELSIGLAKESPDARADTELYLRTCVNSEIRRSVTPETLTSDAERIYRYVAQHHFVDASNVVVNRWWKQWFIDDTSIMELLRDYNGHVAFHIGEIDSQLPAEREIQYMTAYVDSMVHEPKVVLHSSRGHAFRSFEPLFGPMDQEAEDMLVEDIMCMLRAG